MTAGRSHRVLVVDDAAANTLMMAEALASRHTVLVANTAQDAIGVALRDPPPDLVLLDVHMPGTDGLETCRLLKGRAETSAIPVVLVTAGGSEQDEAAGFAAGAVDFIHRPISAELLRARVGLHLRLKDQADALRVASLLDDLTGLPNRRRFDSEITLRLAQSIAFNAPLSLIMIDIDYFKHYNDTLGHIEGDNALKAVAGALSGTLSRGGDVLARWGGEEFAVILPDADAQGAVQVASRMLAAVRALGLPHPGSECSDVVTVSAGIADSRSPRHLTASDLIEAADRQLYRAKSSGRDRVAWPA